MTRDEWLASLKVGDEVAVVRYERFTGTTRIAEIYSSGAVRVDMYGERFDSNGEHSASKIVPPNGPEHFAWVKARLHDEGVLRPATLPDDFDFAANIAHLRAVLSAMRDA